MLDLSAEKIYNKRNILLGGYMKKQHISFMTFLSLVIGSVVGIGIFLKSGRVLNIVEGSGGLAVLAWGIGGLISMAAALTIAEIGSQVKGSGGLSSMIRIGAGRLLGFLTGWFQLFYIAGMIAPITVFVMQFYFSGVGITNPAPWMYIVGTLFIFFCSLGINVMSEAAAGWVQQITVYIKLIPIALIIFSAIFLQGNIEGGVAAVTFSEVSQSPFTLIALALPAVLFSYDGWVFATTVAEKMKNPKKEIPLGLISGIAFVTVLYVAVNLGVLLSGQPNVAAALTSYFHFDASRIVFIIIAISAYGVINGYQMMAKYFAYGLAETNDFFMPEKFRQKTSKGIPTYSTILTAVIILVVLAVQMFIPLAGTAEADFSKVEKGYSYYVDHKVEAKVSSVEEFAKSDVLKNAEAADAKAFAFYSAGTGYYGTEKPTLDNSRNYLTAVFYDRQANYISDMFTVAMWIFYIILFVSVVVMRFTRPDMKRPYKMPAGIFPVAPLLAIGGASYFIYTNVTEAYKAPGTLLFGLPTFVFALVVIVGIGAILFFTNVQKHEPIELGEAE